jgi:exopolysaccharide production protein ExoQ
MNQQTATIFYIICILGLFFLDRDAKAQTSKALWIPVTWLLIVGSRPVSMWFQAGPTMAQGDLGTEGSPLDAAVFGILIAAGVLALSSRWNRVSKFLRWNAPILLFFVYCGVSILWSDYSFVALKRWIKAVGDVEMVLIILTDPNPLAATKRFFSRTAFVLLPLSVLFIKYYPNLGRAYNPWTWIPMYSGVTTFKNLLGMTCLVCGLGSLWSFVSAYETRKMPHRFRHLIAHGIILAMTMWLCVTADSMTSLSCFLLAGAVMVMTTRRWVIKRVSVVHALVGGCVGLSLCALFADTGGTMVHSLGRDPSLTGRTGIWKAVLSLHSNPLLGAGFESFWLGERLQKVWDMTEKGIQEAHNGYLELYLNLGWIGVILLAWLIVTGYRHVLAVFRRDPHAGRIRLAFFTAGVIYSLTEAGFRMMSPIWIGFLLAITGVPPNLHDKNRQRSTKLAMTQVVLPAKVEAVVPELV